MGIRLQRGRLFDDRDTEAAPGAVLVSEAAARRLWPGKDPIGQQLTEPTYRGAALGAPLRWQTVVGVVDDVRYRGLNHRRLDVYTPAAQSANRVQHSMVRTSGDTATAVDSVRAAVREADPSAAVSEATVMSDAVAAESAPWRFLTQVFLGFASLAALLATVGLGAIVAIEVTARRRELGRTKRTAPFRPGRRGGRRLRGAARGVGLADARAVDDPGAGCRLQTRGGRHAAHRAATAEVRRHAKRQEYYRTCFHRCGRSRACRTRRISAVCRW